MCGSTREMSVFSERGVYGFSAVPICYFILCGFNFIMDPGGWVRAVALNPRSQSWGDYDSCV